MQERGLVVSKSFRGTFTMSGRLDGKDCAVSSQDINGKVVVLIPMLSQVLH
jgi:hypothetical protein